jgi:hypothetical protein
LNAENLTFGVLSFFSMIKNDTDLKAWTVMYEFNIILIAMEVISTIVSAVIASSYLDALFFE